MKTSSKVLILSAGMLISSSAFSQTTVKGIFADSLTNETIPFGTVAVNRDGKPSDFVMTTITDVDGSFKGIIPANGKYQITLRSTGKQIIIRDLLVSGQKVLDLGKVFTADQVDTLGVVEVVAIKPLIKAEADRLSYNAQADPEAKTATVLDLLKKVPLVSVDAEDNIEINGSSSFQVHINGKKNTMLTNRPSENLKSMPASTVLDIEIITDPGAKYDSEGVGGIINLITEKSQKVNQNSGSIRLGIGSRGQENANVSLAMQRDKLTLSMNASINKNSRNENTSHSMVQNLSNGDDNIIYNVTDGSSESKGMRGSMSFQASYEIDTLNLVSVDFGFSRNKRENYGESFYDIYGYSIDDHIRSLQYSEGEGGNTDFWVGVDYQRSFRYNPKSSLTFSYKTWQGNGDNSSLSEKKTESNNSDNRYDMSSRYQDNENKSAEHTLQIDYATPIAQGLEAEAGVKYVYRPQSSWGDYYNIDNAGIRTLNPLMGSEFESNDNITAAYLQFVERYKALTFKAGVRYEHTFQSSDNKKQDNGAFSVSYPTAVPTVSLTYKIGMTSNVSFQYGLRIQRPRISQMNPYINKTALTWQYGNPDLDPEKYHNMTLGYGFFSMKHNVNLRLRYSTSSTGVTDYEFYEGDIQHRTYVNATKNQNVTFNGYYGFNPSRKTRLMASGTIRYVDYDNPLTGDKNSGYNYNYFASVTQTLPWKIRGSVGVHGSSRRYNIRGYSDGMTFGNISFTKDFLQDKMTFSVSMNTPLNEFWYMNHYSYSQTDQSISEREFRSKSGRINVSLQWRFGKSRINVKKTKATIDGGGDQGGESSEEGGE